LKKQLSKLKYLSKALIKNPSYLLTFFKAIRGEEIYNNQRHIQLAADWLLKAQENGNDAGYSRGFYLYKKGWDKSYIETTGYIIPTMLEIAKYLDDEKYFHSAYNAGEWLLEVQNDSGSFSDIDNGVELVFDTGQVLYGLIALFENDKIIDKDKKRYLNAIEKAAVWLCKVQDNDGSWSRYGYQQIGHSYYTRVAYILYKAGIVCQNEDFKKSSSHMIEWTLKQQSKNGFFDKLYFSKEQKPLLHTMIYVLEGLYDYYKLTKSEKVWSALIKNAEKLKEINLNRDLLLCSQYNENFECVNNERCMTGLAQWSNLAFQLYEKTLDKGYLQCAERTLYYLNSKQFKNNVDLKGSLPGSVPFWGEYAPFSAVNWGVKFYIDAMLHYVKYEKDLITQSNMWIGSCFQFKSSVVNSAFTKTGERYQQFLKKYVEKSKRVLDLGSGEGKYVRYFNTLFQREDIRGVDSYFYDDKNIKKGNVYEISIDETFDLIYTIEVLQYVKYMEIALSNICQHLSDEGYLIICDRNPKSIIGFLKPLYEYLGMWMYPYDSPFSEKWYSLNEWNEMLENNGFKVENIKSFTSKTGKLGWMNRYSMIVARKV
jgi:SAM-dependent methyltransferase